MFFFLLDTFLTGVTYSLKSTVVNSIILEWEIFYFHFLCHFEYNDELSKNN